MREHYFKSVWIIIILCLIATMFSPAFLEATRPVIYSITPDKGKNFQPTQVVITGSDFQETSRASFYGGGPYTVNDLPFKGLTKGVYAQGSYVYVADESEGLQVVDISDPQFSYTVASCDTPGSAIGVHIMGSYAYVADCESGLRIIDINDPLHPQIIGSCDTPGLATNVYCLGSYAYIADGEAGLQVMDISDPNHPVIIGSCKVQNVLIDPNTPKVDLANDVYVLGHYAYTAYGEAGLQVMDISDPEHPVITGSCTIKGAVNGIYVSGVYAYMSNIGAGLQIIDIHEPHTPHIVGSYNVRGAANDIFVVDSYAYVTFNDLGMHIIDVKDPSYPRRVGSCPMPYARGVYVSDGYAYITYGIVYDIDAQKYIIAGLSVININNPVNPSAIGFLDSHDWSFDVTAADSYAYVADGVSGLQMIDITAPSKPKVAGSCDTPGLANGITIAGSYAYISDGAYGLQIIDISNPSNLHITAFIDTNGQANGIAINGSCAYMADGNSGLQIIDIHALQNLTIIGSCAMPEPAMDISVIGNYAYVTAGTAGLQVVDIHDPNKPAIVGACRMPEPFPQPSMDVFIQGDYAYVTDGIKGLLIIDIHDPNNPVIVGTCFTRDEANGVYVDGSYAYVANGFGGLKIVDITNPSMPVIAGSSYTPGYASNVSILGSYIYVADGGSGLQIMEGLSPLSIDAVDLTDLMANTMTVTVPPGIHPGVYDLYLTNPEGESTILRNAFSSSMKQEIQLHKGWNLISFQIRNCYYEKETPAVFIPEGIMKTAHDSLLTWLSDDTNSPIRDEKDPNRAGDWQRITSFDTKGAHILDKKLPPFINTLKYISAGYGYWIKMNQPGKFIVEGMPFPINTALILQNGWNLVGILPYEICYADINKDATCPFTNGDYAIDENISYYKENPLFPFLLSSIKGKYRRITGFDNCKGATLYDINLPTFINTLHYLGPEFGYWMKIEYSAGAALLFP